jgi:hypothetical protein
MRIFTGFSPPHMREALPGAGQAAGPLLSAFVTWSTPFGFQCFYRCSIEPSAFPATRIESRTQERHYAG